MLILIGFIAMKYFSEELPQGQSGTEADKVANLILTAVNKPAFDSINYLRWEFFRPGQKYFWDKENNDVIIKWAENEVHMDLNTQQARCLANGEVQTGASHDKLKQKAWSNWCNDSFWMIAPFKLFDTGTTRELVTTDKGQGLKVTYVSGGVTPGDSYLWSYDENYRPTGWKMWTQILPIDGLYTSWANWEDHGGAMLSTAHTIAGKEMLMKEVKAGQHWSEFGYKKNPFTLNK